MNIYRNLNFSLDNQEEVISDISSQGNQEKNYSFPFECLPSDIYIRKQKENCVNHNELLLLSLINNSIESQEPEIFAKPKKDKKDNLKDENKNMNNNELVLTKKNETKICFMINKCNGSESQKEKYLNKKKSFTGRKKGNDNTERKHNKYSDDNIRKNRI